MVQDQKLQRTKVDWLIWFSEILMWTQNWTFDNYFKSIYKTWKSPNKKVIHFYKLYNFDIWTFVKFFMDFKFLF
jgi:hypothetical protein